MAAEYTQQPRLMTPDELGAVVKFFREMRHWSQEQLGDIAGVSCRTVQRVEAGKPSDLDTRRALATAFELEDIDVFSKPFVIPTDDEMKTAKEKFDLEYITLPASPLTTGKELAGLVETTMMDLSTPAFEMTRAADETFADLQDCFREYRDCADMYSERDKFEVYDALQVHLDALRAEGVILCYATRKVEFKGTEEAKPWTTMALYVIAFPLGKAPTEFATPRAIVVGG